VAVAAAAAWAEAAAAALRSCRPAAHSFIPNFAGLLAAAMCDAPRGPYIAPSTPPFTLALVFTATLPAVLGELFTLFFAEQVTA
jgi:hypothetical protein